MVEIFTVAGGGAAPSRYVGNEVTLNTPAKVYFGVGAPGIAFYEKSGADLKVTLLDGQEVIIKNFFIIGNAGDYSSLLDGGAAGGVEVTGLIAPEPFVGASVTVAASEISPEPTPAPVAAPKPAPVVEAPAPAPLAMTDVAPVESAPAEAEAAGGGALAGGGGGTLFGDVGLDRMLFAAAYVPAILTLSRDDTAVGEAPVIEAPAPDEGAADEAGAEDPHAHDEELPEEVAALLSEDGGSEELEFAGDAAGFGDFPDLGENMLFDQGRDALSALLDDFNALAQSV